MYSRTEYWAENKPDSIPDICHSLIVADVLTKQGLKRDRIDDIMTGNFFKNVMD